MLISFSADPAILTCNCNKSLSFDKDNGLILTGDLRIIKNNKMRKNKLHSE